MSLTFHVGNRTLAPCRVFCIGRNYGEHIKELAHEVPAEPVVFMKPVPSLEPPGKTLRRPPYGKQLHHEAEVVLLIGKEGKDLTTDEAESHIAGITLGLDLTLRDVQNELRSKGLPWELCKAFDQSAPIGDFAPYDKNSVDLENIPFACAVNGQIRQRGNSRDMIFPIKTLIAYLSGKWTLRPGDLIYTGTPSGVGPLNPGDMIAVESERIGRFVWTMA